MHLPTSTLVGKFLSHLVTGCVLDRLAEVGLQFLPIIELAYALLDFNKGLRKNVLPIFLFERPVSCFRLCRQDNHAVMPEFLIGPFPLGFIVRLQFINADAHASWRTSFCSLLNANAKSISDWFSARLSHCTSVLQDISWILRPDFGT